MGSTTSRWIRRAGSTSRTRATARTSRTRLREPGVYRIDPDGSVTRIISDAARPNGIAICPDERHITVGSYDYEADDRARDGAAALRSGAGRQRRQPSGAGRLRSSSTAPTVWYATPKAICGSRSETPVGPASTPIRWRTGSRGNELTFRPRSSRPTSISAAAMLPNYLYVTAGNSLYGIRVGKRGHHLQRRSSAHEIEVEVGAIGRMRPGSSGSSLGPATARPRLGRRPASHDGVEAGPRSR